MRVLAALDRWHDARRAVNDPHSVPDRLDRIISVVGQTVSATNQDVVIEIDALLMELAAIRFPVNPEDALTYLENATLSVDGALNRFSRSAARAGFAEVDEDLGLPPGIRIPLPEIASQLEAFVRATREVKPVIDSIERAQGLDRDSGVKQGALVKGLVRSAFAKIAIIEIKSDRQDFVDVSGIASVAQQLVALLQSFVSTVRDASQHISHWLSRGVEAAIPQAIAHINSSISRLVARTSKWIHDHGQKANTERQERAPSDRTELNFDLLEAERQLLEGTTPSPDVIPYVTSLDGSYDNRALAAVGQMKQLRKLSINLKEPSDLSPLRNLLGLQSLDIFGEMRDFSPLSGLTKLQSLSLGTDNTDADLLPLSNLVNLTALHIYNSSGKNAGSLSSLKRLKFLGLNDSGLDDIAFVAALTMLEELNLSDTSVIDLSPLENLISLKSLDLDATKITDLRPIAGLINLESLECRRTQVSDVTPLAGLSNLQIALFSNTQLNDLTPLANLSSLRKLDASWTAIPSIAPLREVRPLQSLDIRGTQVNDLSPLAQHPSLQTLDITGSAVRDLSSLKYLPTLQRLTVSSQGSEELIQTLDRPIEEIESYANHTVFRIT
jgi:internalin A